MKFQFCLAKPEEGGVALDDSSTKHSGRYLQILFNNYKVFASIFKCCKKFVAKYQRRSTMSHIIVDNADWEK